MRWIPLILAGPLLFAQGTKPKAAPSEYDVHTSAGSLDIGAEYMVHSFSSGEEMFVAEDFLVVEVAFYPLMKTDELTIDPAKFGLRLNGKTLLHVAAPEEVAKSLRYPASRRPGRFSGGIGAGPIGIPVGGGGGNPGGYPPQTRPMPKPPGTPESDPSNGIERKRATPEEVLMETYLPAGPHKGAVSGFVYFPFTGKPASLKSVELEYGGATLKLK